MKKTILQSLIASCLLATLPALAQEGNKDSGGNFDIHKAEAIKTIDEQIDSLNKFKGCISSATKHDDIHNCRKDHRESMKGLRAEMKEKHIERMKEHRDKIDEKIKKIESTKSEEKK